MSKLACGALAALFATAAVAAPAAAPPLLLNPADCSARPNADNLARYYPRRAAALAVGGRVVLQCVVGDTGLVQACAVVSEDPADMGFARAAMRLSALFRMRATTRDGVATAGKTVRIPIRFEVPGEPPPAPASPPPQVAPS